MANIYSRDDYPLQDETYEIIGIAMEIHRILGKGLLEIVYKDALEYELIKRTYHISLKKNVLYNIKTLYYHISFM